jgi:hypothetical protein
MASTSPAPRRRARAFVAVAVTALLGVAVASVRAQPTEGKTFETPRAAGDALVAACEAADAQAALVGIFGAEALDLITTADEAYDTTSRRQLAALARQQLDVSETGDTATLVIGFSAWPFPVPLVRSAGAWRFDLVAGRREILARRIGRNELEAIALLKAYPDAQRAYAAVDRDGDGALEFARRLASTPGTHDGLYWETSKPDEEASPFGPLVAAAGEYGAERKAGAPWFGYRFKVLTKQGAHAPGGAYDYTGPKGDMLGGFALVAWPAEYRKLGVMTFMVGREGRVLQADLGEKTADLAAAIDAFDPDASWTAADAPGN